MGGQSFKLGWGTFAVLYLVAILSGFRHPGRPLQKLLQWPLIPPLVCCLLS